ncbi:hypothetical protein GOP56_05030 [Brevibacillus sp. 7WMA2]|uniref:Uncharacterized protein n=1 Tax=Brevibacillus laterosporus LMG 15441 TaxID=1042163 RepID=A0A075RB94_BRELA|nr:MULTISPECIES: hypothetical protein [Brevibacillus]AIG26765.1 hypothetical protein BRLA_c024450 [Brevibacillus laterosporus LMG 15441]AUM65245.1 hypothetical protein C0R09_12305 [Brevibacillus laterosporus]ERM18310.1 hypothetical protein P615_17140 [Brevibacillus laterosporus PE36]MBA4532765.1 hypothetical protein [Brevibacillus halotolerans]MCR8963847.1 hypothetical protein [Brevibacillus laterosporus]
MLTFEQKKAIIESFPELTKKEVSLGRLNYHFEGSLHDKKIVVNHLHPNGNGFVYAGHLPKKKTGPKGMVNIRDYSEEQLRSLIADSIAYLSTEQEANDNTLDSVDPIEEIWVNQKGDTLRLVQEDELFNIYTGNNLEDSYNSYKGAVTYLQSEDFTRQE